MESPASASPPSLLHRILRSLRSCSHVRGWQPIAQYIAGPHRFDAGQTRATVDCYGRRFDVDLSSWVEWNMYMFGGYEADRIDRFLAIAPRDGVLLDVGANIGNHSLAMSRHFTAVHAFEPNPVAFARLRQNISANPSAPVTAVNAGLGSLAGTLPFFQPLEGAMNQGTGTFVAGEAPEAFQILELPILKGDDYVSSHLRGSRIAAIKIDVQGFEPAVLDGFADTIASHRPVIWLEATPSTRQKIAASLPKYPYRVDRFMPIRTLALLNGERLRPATVAELMASDGDYLISAV